MWLPKIDQQCPLMGRLQRIRNGTRCVAFKCLVTEENDDNVQRLLPDTKDSHDDCNQRTMACPKPAVCEPLYYYDIPVSSCDLACIKMDQWTMGSQGAYTVFQNPVPRYIQGQVSHHHGECGDRYGVGNEDLLKKVTSATTLELSKQFWPAWLFPKILGKYSSNVESPFVLLVLALEGCFINLYMMCGCPTLDSNSDPCSFSPMSKALYLLASTDEASGFMGVSCSRFISALAVSSLPSSSSSSDTNTVPSPIVIVAGTSDGQIAIWITETHCNGKNMTKECNLKLNLLFSGRLSSNESAISSILIVHGETTPLSSNSSAPVMKLVLVAAQLLGPVFQWKLSLQVPKARNTVDPLCAAEDHPFQKTTLGSQRRRLWAADDQLGPVVEAKLRSFQLTSTPDITNNTVKFGVFACLNGIIALELIPELRLIFRRILVAPTQSPSCCFCFLNTSTLLGSQFELEKRRSLRDIDSDIQNLLVSVHGFSTSTYTHHPLLLITFYVDPTKKQWIVLQQYAISEVDTPWDPFPKFQCMTYLEETQVLVGLDSSGQWWVAVEESAEPHPAEKTLHINFAFQAIDRCEDLKTATLDRLQRCDIFAIPTSLSTTSFVLCTAGIFLKVQRYTATELEDMRMLYMQRLTTSYGQRGEDLLYPPVDSTTVFIGLLLDIIHNCVVVDSTRTTACNDDTANRIVGFCSSFLSDILEYIEKKKESVILLYDLLVTLDEQYYHSPTLVSSPQAFPHYPSVESQETYESLCDLMALSPSLFVSQDVCENVHKEDNAVQQDVNVISPTSLWSAEQMCTPDSPSGALMSSQDKEVRSRNPSVTLTNQVEFGSTAQCIAIPYWTSECALAIHRKLLDLLVSLNISNALLLVAEILSISRPDTWLNTSLPEAFPVLLSRILGNITVPSPCEPSILIKALSMLNWMVVSNTMHLSSVVLCQNSIFSQPSLLAEMNVDESEYKDFFTSHTRLCTVFEALLMVHRYRENGNLLYNFILSRLLDMAPVNVIPDYLGYLFSVHRQRSSTLEVCAYLSAHMDEIIQKMGVASISLMLHLIQNTLSTPLSKMVCETAQAFFIDEHTNLPLRTHDNQQDKALYDEKEATAELYLWKAFTTVHSWFTRSSSRVAWCARVIQVLMTIPDATREPYETLFVECPLGGQELYRELIYSSTEIPDDRLKYTYPPILKLPKLTLCLAVHFHSALEALTVLQSLFVRKFDAIVDISGAEQYPLYGDFSSMVFIVLKTLAWFFYQHMYQYPTCFISRYASSLLVPLSCSRSLWATCQKALRFFTFQLQLRGLVQGTHAIFDLHPHESVDLMHQPLIVDGLRILSQYEQLIELDIALCHHTVVAATTQVMRQKHRGYVIQAPSSTSSHSLPLSMAWVTHTVAPSTLESNASRSSNIQGPSTPLKNNDCAPLSVQSKIIDPKDDSKESPSEWRTQQLCVVQNHLNDHRVWNVTELAKGSSLMSAQ